MAAKKTKTFDKEAYQKDIVNLTRKILGGVQLNDIDFVENLSPQDKAHFLKYCSEFVSNPWFDKLFSALYFPHVMEAVNKAENYDIVSFHRATLNGISFVKEFMAKNDRRYHEEVEVREPKFDPVKPFDSADADDLFQI